MKGQETGKYVNYNKVLLFQGSFSYIIKLLGWGSLYQGSTVENFKDSDAKWIAQI